MNLFKFRVIYLAAGICIFNAILGSTHDVYAGMGAPQGLNEGMTAFQDHRWMEAMGDFLGVLERDPGNGQAHKYLNLIAQQMKTERHAIVEEIRLNLLDKASKRLQGNRKDVRPVENAILETTQSAERMRNERLHALTEEAGAAIQLGHLLVANDRVLTVLSEVPNHIEAQQQLSELQSREHLILENGGDNSVEERFALQGFYAYGQADYAAALDSWTKAKTLIDQSFPPPEAARHLANLHFVSYLQIAQAHVDDSRREQEAQRLFSQGMELYQDGNYFKALDTFRKLAILNPEYPQLGNWLALAEAAEEKDRANRLGERKRSELAVAYGEGVAAMEHEKYADAQQAFGRVLAIDPTHLQARAYQAMAEAELRKIHDPKAAQQHYESGLIAYASGKLEEATREWRIATRMDPANQKAVNALAKVQKELAFSSDVP